MSDRILICDVCRKEIPDYEVKAMINKSYLGGGFYCPYCQRETNTIIKSSKGTPETGNYKIEVLPTYYGRCRSEYTKGESVAALIPKVKKIRDRKKAARLESLNKENNEIPKKENDEIPKEDNGKRMYYLKWGITHKYEMFLKQYKSKEEARKALYEWINKNEERVEFMKMTNFKI